MIHLLEYIVVSLLTIMAVIWMCIIMFPIAIIYRVIMGVFFNIKD